MSSKPSQIITHNQNISKNQNVYTPLIFDKLFKAFHYAVSWSHRTNHIATRNQGQYYCLATEIFLNSAAVSRTSRPMLGPTLSAMCRRQLDTALTRVLRPVFLYATVRQKTSQYPDSEWFLKWLLIIHFSSYLPRMTWGEYTYWTSL
jgi:hypothetical protein